MSKDCTKGWHTGDCCCNCKSQKRVMCHPWNKDVGRGPITQQLGWACTVMFSDGSNRNEVIFFDRKHGFCELHDRK